RKRGGGRGRGGRRGGGGWAVGAVCPPTTMASIRPRSSCTLPRDAGLLIHFDSRSRVAILPSSDMAHLAWTYGRPVLTSFKYGSFSRRASVSPRPISTTTPAARNRSAPSPATAGNGSVIAATTRPTLARTIASAHGGA